ncbi:MAG TPA: heme lyase CcmF/NrfE family subunit, partial [Paracoccaceae bacterium]|nr:heme lyase CcmF/NrfE family subunit [Paracoccaceae bacterium]
EYRIAAVWGGHEGSLLLWVLMLTLWMVAVSVFSRHLPDEMVARVLGVMGLVSIGFLGFMLFTSNPFDRMIPAAADGRDLNPLLQDAGMIFHPPMLYAGYVGLSMAYAFAIAALIEGRVDASWARWVRPWTLSAWMFLTIGIALGSYWAYYELGWGGWWFWDPVENASFMPWLVAAALLHSAIVVEKRESLKVWTVLLAILAFSFSLIGTFIVRSGVITSVHAFANDPARGVFILAILAVAIGGALTLYAWRAPMLASKGVFGLVSRESGLVLNNLLLVVAAFVVFIGTLWPLIAEFATGAKISVGAPFFETAFTPFMLILALALPIGAILPWKRALLARTMGPLLPALILALALGGLAWSVGTGRSLVGPIGIAVGAWLVLGAAAELFYRAKAGQVAAAETLRRLTRLPRADWGKAIAHAGLGLTIFGIAAVTAWEREDVRVMRLGESLEIGDFTVTLAAVERLPVGADFHVEGCGRAEPTGLAAALALFREVGPRNFTTDLARFEIARDGRRLSETCAEKRFYPVARMPTTEAGIEASLLRDIYVVLGDPQEGGGWAVRSYVKPFANWIWLGALVMAGGGLFSLSDRRYRVGAALRTQAPKGAMPAE